jgi:hypothetical protein
MPDLLLLLVDDVMSRKQNVSFIRVWRQPFIQYMDASIHGEMLFLIGMHMNFNY